MAMLLFTVEQLYHVPQRGVVVLVKKSEADSAVWNIGDPLELRFADGRRLATKICGFGTYPPGSPLVPYMLSLEIGSEDVPAGTEVWTVG
jgi:hypothetical protein